MGLFVIDIIGVRDVTVSEGMTVQLTPCSRFSEGLAVENRTNSGFDIYELHGGKGNYEVDWQVTCVRRMHEDYSPIRKWDETIADESDKKLAWNKRVTSIQAKEAAYATRKVAKP